MLIYYRHTKFYILILKFEGWLPRGPKRTTTGPRPVSQPMVRHGSESDIVPEDKEEYEKTIKKMSEKEVLQRFEDLLVCNKYVYLLVIYLI